MPRIPGVRRVFRLPWRTRADIGAEVDEELQFHLDMRADELARGGMEREAALAQARREFGDLEEARRFCRDMDARLERRSRRADWLDGLAQDLRFTARSLLANPGFTAAAVLALALGTGATTVIFSAVDTVLLRPLPVAEPGGLVTLRVEEGDGSLAGGVSYPFYREVRAAGARALDVAAAHYGEVSFRAGDQAEVVLGVDASDNYFGVLGVRPALGRLFGPAEEPVGASPAVVISHAFWRRRFGGDPGVVGRTVRLNRAPFTVVGVAPEGFGGTIVGVSADVWVPVSAYELLHPGRSLARERGGHTWLNLIGRRRPGVTREGTEAALDAALRSVPPEFPSASPNRGARLQPLTGVPPQARGAATLFMSLLLATAALVMLIASTNVAGMLLARAAARQREIAIRLAIGAGRGRLVRQLLTESVVLFLLGGAGGTLLAVWAVRLLRGVRLPLPVQVSLDFPVDLRVLAFALSVSLVTGLVFGLAPAVAASRPSLVPALKEGSPRGGRRGRLRGAFVVGQLAMSLLLLLSAGLFVRALQRALAVDTGFDPDGVVVASLDLGAHGYDAERGQRLQRELLERVRATPGVLAAGLATMVPLSGEWDETRVRPAEGGDTAAAGFNAVDGEYFRTLGIPLLAGRTFTDRDRTGAPPVVVINRTLGERLWPGRSPVGQRMQANGMEAEVVGVVPDGKYESIREEPRAFLYVPAGQVYSERVTLHVRAAPGAEGAALGALRRELRALDPDLPLGAPMPMAAMTGAALVPQRIAAWLIGLFGVVGLVLAAVGVYGLLAYSVSQRTREIGVRMALGAERAAVLRLVLGQGAALVAAGVAVGLAGALAASRVLAGMLYGLSATDPLTFVAVPLLVAAAGLLASWLPARRATRVDPLVALRAD
ncbi:MAG TPA: ABC transporter permease [Longimicrobium sp.]|jgi:predicted permease